MVDAASRDRKKSQALVRLLKPTTIAVVGLSDASDFAEYIKPTLDGTADVFFVNPNHPEVLGQRTYPTLRSIDRPLDAVISMMGAARSAALAEEAADLDVGGLVLIAGGFAELDDGGADLQTRVKIAATGSGMAVIGPNGLGYVNVRRKVSLTLAAQHKRRPGGISVVSQSGAMLSGVAMAAWDYEGVGLNLLIGAGNEAVTDLADYVEYLAADDETKAIALIVEKIRRPAAFFAAVRRATDAGKPIVALKLARGTRSQRIALSHTGALTGDAWIYDIAFRQAGIALAYDPEELVDRLAIADQLAPERWTSAQGLGVITMTGGYASLAVDLAASEGVPLPELTDLEPWVRAILPGITVANPLDATGFGFSVWPSIVERFATCAGVDALLFVHPLAEEDASFTQPVADEFARRAADSEKMFVIANCSGTPGTFVAAKATPGTLAFGRGLRSSLRGLQTLGAFVRHRAEAVDNSQPVAPLAYPSHELVSLSGGKAMAFADTMELLREHDISVAPYFLLSANEQCAASDIPFPEPYVVKLANVAHRTELDGVKVSVSSDGLSEAIEAVRERAHHHHVSPQIVIQPMVRSVGELFVSSRGSTELGPLVMLGLGGIFVEALGRLGGRMAPLSQRQAHSLISEFADTKVMHGFRGQPEWDLDALAGVLVTMGRLAAGAAVWLQSLEINPLIFDSRGFVAVDALCIIADGLGGEVSSRATLGCIDQAAG
jgi:acyl-CoA synthetase (NDP forming)